MASIRTEADLFTVIVRIRTPSTEERAQVLDTCRETQQLFARPARLRLILPAPQPRRRADLQLPTMADGGRPRGLPAQPRLSKRPGRAG